MGIRTRKEKCLVEAAVAGTREAVRQQIDVITNHDGLRIDRRAGSSWTEASDGLANPLCRTAAREYGRQTLKPIRYRLRAIVPKGRTQASSN